MINLPSVSFNFDFNITCEKGIKPMQIPREFKILEGKTISHIIGGHHHDEHMIFICSDKTQYKLFHDQDCCEQVYIEDVVGDLKDLIGSPILGAEEVINDRESDRYEGSSTWTFYKLKTIKGYVDIRWCGSSNGYYSENVDFVETDEQLTDVLLYGENR